MNHRFIGHQKDEILQTHSLEMKTDGAWIKRKTMNARRPPFSRTNAQSDYHLKAAQNEAELGRNLLTLKHILNT